MILNWYNPNNNYRAFERVIGCIFDAGGILFRDDLKTLLGYSEDMMRYTIYRLNKHDPQLIRRIRTADRRNTYAFMLTEQGVAYARDLTQWDNKVRVGEGQVYHTLGINSILLRIVREIGTKGYEWYCTREAGDIIADHIYSNMTMQEQARREKPRFIRPDALFSVGHNKVCVEYDTGSESGRIIKNKLQSYHQTMLRLPESWRVVVFVAPTEARRKFLEEKSREFDTTAYKAHFFIPGQETAGFVQRVKRGVRASV